MDEKDESKQEAKKKVGRLPGRVKAPKKRDTTVPTTESPPVEAVTLEPPLTEAVDTTVFDNTDAPVTPAATPETPPATDPTPPVAAADDENTDAALGPAPNHEEAERGVVEPIPPDSFEVPKSLPKIGADTPPPAAKAPETTPPPAAQPKVTEPTPAPETGVAANDGGVVVKHDFVQVSRQFKNGRVLTAEDATEEKLNVRRFHTFPANVGITESVTLNVGDYESCKIAVTLNVPCHIEEVEDAYDFAYRFVEDRVAKEVAEVKKGPRPATATTAPTPAASPSPATKPTPAATPKVKAARLPKVK